MKIILTFIFLFFKITLHVTTESKTYNGLFCVYNLCKSKRPNKQ